MPEIIPKIDDIVYLDLGQSGENQTRTIRIDVSDWLTELPDVEIFVVAMRSGEMTPYPATTTMQDGILSWPLQAADTAKTGTGWAEVQAVNLQGQVKKSKLMRTVVDRSLSDIDADPDEPLRGYIEQLLSAAAVIYRSRFRVISDTDGSVELGGGSTEEGGYLLDTGLAIQGRAADAKAVGDALALKADAGSGIYDPLRAWPIGSIYMSEDETSPESLFGGEWEKVEGAFLLGASESYEVSSTGGEADVKLVTNQIPAGV